MSDVNRDSKGLFVKGHTATRTKRIHRRGNAAEAIDKAAAQLAKEFKGMRAEKMFSNGFEPIKEMLRLYAGECQKKKPDFDKQGFILRTIMPYIYPTLRAIEFDSGAAVSILPIMLASDDTDADQGKGKNGVKISIETK